MLNSRKPFCTVSLLPAEPGPAGLPLSGLLSVEVNNNGYFAADTFTVVFALPALGAGGGPDLAALLARPRITLAITLGVNASDSREMIAGQVDELRFDPAQNTVEMSGRDFSALFVDSSDARKWTQATASQIATTLAREHGLSPVVTPTREKVGSYQNGYQSRLADARSQWDLLCWLAQQCVAADGTPFVVQLRGLELYFGPRPALPDYVLACRAADGQAPFALLPAAAGAGPAWGGSGLSFTRNVSTLRQLTLELESRGTHRPPLYARWPQQGGGPVHRRRWKPNQTPEQLQKDARVLWRQLAQHELRLNLSLPGDSLLDAHAPIRVSGVGSGFDQLYYADSVTRRLDSHSGYTMEVSAKNLDPLAAGGEG